MQQRFKDNLKIASVIIALIAFMLGTMYVGWKFPELWIYHADPMGFTVQPSIMIEKNITQYCTPKTIGFTGITTIYWCIA